MQVMRGKKMVLNSNALQMETVDESGRVGVGSAGSRDLAPRWCQSQQGAEVRCSLGSEIPGPARRRRRLPLAAEKAARELKCPDRLVAQLLRLSSEASAKLGSQGYCGEATYRERPRAQ